MEKGTNGTHDVGYEYNSPRRTVQGFIRVVTRDSNHLLDDVLDVLFVTESLQYQGEAPPLLAPQMAYDQNRYSLLVVVLYLAYISTRSSDRPPKPTLICPRIFVRTHHTPGFNWAMPASPAGVRDL